MEVPTQDMTGPRSSDYATMKEANKDDMNASPTNNTLALN